MALVKGFRKVWVVREDNSLVQIETDGNGNGREGGRHFFSVDGHYLFTHARQVDRSDQADAARFRWLLDGSGYFMEEAYLCGQHPTTVEEQDNARRKIDEAIREQNKK